MKKFNFPLERMLNYQEQDLEKERGDYEPASGSQDGA